MSTIDTSATRPNPNTAREARKRDPAHVARLLDQLPPHAIEAEMCLLGAILIEPRVLGDVSLIIKDAEDFYKPANGAIYACLFELYDASRTVDIVQLNQILVDRDLLDAIGGQDYLVELARSVPSAYHAEDYARLVREKAMVRRLIEETSAILHEAYTNSGEAATILDDAEHRIFSIAEHYEQRDVATLAMIINDLAKEMETGRPATGVLTGFADLDEITGGLQKGDFIIIAGRPSMGKTAFALNMVENIAMRGDPVGVFSLEMSKRALVERLLAGRAGIDLSRLRRMMLRNDQMSKFLSACGDLHDAPIYMDDLGASTLLQIRARARRLVAKHAVKVIIVDYIQLVTSGGRVESRQLEVSEISRGLKSLARELDVPVVALSQLNRSPEQRETHRPRLSDLRESGSLEQDADVVGLLHREAYYHKGDEDWAMANSDKADVAELIIAKQRNGPTDVVKMTWHEASTRFRDYSPRSAPDDYYDPGADAEDRNSGGAPSRDPPF